MNCPEYRSARPGRKLPPHHLAYMSQALKSDPDRIGTAMSYEEACRYCPACRKETWHGRDVLDVFRPRSLTVFSHLITVFNDVCISWRCLECGRRSRGRVRPGKTARAPGKPG